MGNKDRQDHMVAKGYLEGGHDMGKHTPGEQYRKAIAAIAALNRELHDKTLKLAKTFGRIGGIPERERRFNAYPALLAACEMIAAARDHNAEHCEYPAYPNGPSDDQCFDDWAADVASDAITKATKGQG